MKIEVLYSPGCPNYRPTVERIQRVLAAESLATEIRSVAVRTHDEAKALMFPGSPTIRVNGEDVEPDQTISPGLQCRLYKNFTGVPSEEIVRLALLRARGRSGA